jgi:hypothetical protein
MNHLSKVKRNLVYFGCDLNYEADQGRWLYSLSDNIEYHNVLDSNPQTIQKEFIKILHSQFQQYDKELVLIVDETCEPIISTINNDFKTKLILDDPEKYNIRFILAYPSIPKFILTSRNTFDVVFSRLRHEFQLNKFYADYVKLRAQYKKQAPILLEEFKRLYNEETAEAYSWYMLKND